MGPLLAVSTFLLAILILLSMSNFVNATSTIEGSMECYDDLTSIIRCADDPDANANLNEGIIDADIPSIVGTIPFP
jgi:hypothetical protein